MITPDERAFRADTAKAGFHLGEAEGRWRLVSLGWPHALIVVTAKDGRHYTLRFNLAGYPATPPTAGPGRRAQRDPCVRLMATEPWRSARRQLPHGLEERIGPVPAVRSRKRHGS